MPASAEQVRAALAASGGNVSRAAAALGMARNNLYKRLAALELDLTPYRRAAAAVAAAPRTVAPPPPRPARVARPVRTSRSFYLRADQVQALEAASFDLTPVLRVRLSPSDVMGRFIDEAFAEWLARTLGRGRA